MKALLRKLFFWDAPAKGAFLHATMALTVSWCMSALLCFIMPVALTQAYDVIHPLIWPVALQVLGIPVVFCVEMLAMAVCLLRLHFLRRESRRTGTPRAWTVRCLGLLTIFCWATGIALPLTHGADWTAYVVPAFALALIGYGCFSCLLRHLERDIVHKGVRWLWRCVAVLWIVSLALAIHAKRAASRHFAELEQRYGHQLTSLARDEWLAQDCRIDVAFWQRAHELLWQKNTPENNDMPDPGNTILPHIAKVVPSTRLSPAERALHREEHAFYRKQLEESAELPALEEMLTGTIPLVTKDDFKGLEVSNTLYVLFELQEWRLFFALEDKNMDAIEATLDRMEKLLDCLGECQKHGFDCYVVAREVSYVRHVVDIVASSLPSEEQLLRLKGRLHGREAGYKPVLEGQTYERAIFFNHEFEFHDVFLSWGVPAPAIYPMFPLMRTLDEAFQERPTWTRRMKINAGRLLLPHVWWAYVNEKRIVFRTLNMDATEIPDDGIGSLSIKMFPEWWWPADNYHRLLATCRATQCAIDAMLEFRQTGAFPAALSNALQDPFTGEPLKYHVGECWAYDNDKQAVFTLQAVQVWSLGSNRRNDDGLGFDLPDDEQRQIYGRDDIRILLPLGG